MSHSISVRALAERWDRREEWVTLQARLGCIPGAWKSGHYWRFRLEDIETYELLQQSGTSIFELSDGAKRRG